MSSMQILNDQLAQVASANSYYTDFKNTWRYLLESYLGGEDYRRGQHLTRYQLETEGEYAARLNTTPYENHCKSVISVYNSFLFQTEPDRDLGSLELLPETEKFLADADLEGRSLDAFLKDASTWSSVFGHAWILMAKPNIGALTRATELEAGVRPYVNLLTPLNVLDWQYTRLPSGYYDLSLFKYIEDINGNVITVKTWTTSEILTEVIDLTKRTNSLTESVLNELGIIPVICNYNARSSVRGIGISDIADIADLCKSIYNMLSEVEQTIRLDSHPSLVKTPETQAGAGAGSIIHMPDNLDPGLKPYMLEFSGASVDSIYKAIEHAVQSIDKMAHTGGVRSTQSVTMSGIAMQTEFQLLNAKLSEKADNLELTEESIWKLFALYQGTEWSGEIDYPDSFSIHDESAEFANLARAKTTATGPEALALIDSKLIQLLESETEALESETEALDTTQDSIENFNQVSCPIATQDIGVNLANRQNAIDTANYGPLNPELPNQIFWIAKANMWNTDTATAKQSLCGNCSFFNETPKILDCIASGLESGGTTGDEWESVGSGQLGYCEAFDFKCKSTRTCDAWVTGGPKT